MSTAHNSRCERAWKSGHRAPEVPVTAATRAWRGQGAPPGCPHPDWCRAAAPPPPHGLVPRQPLLTAFSHQRPGAAREALGKPELGQRGHRRSRLSARGRGQGEGGEQTTVGPQPSCAHPPPSLTLLGICKQRLRNAAQRERAEERGNPHPTPPRTATPRRKVRPPGGAHPAPPSQPRVAQRSREPRPLARLRPRAPEAPSRRLDPLGGDGTVTAVWDELCCFH